MIARAVALAVALGGCAPDLAGAHADAVKAALEVPPAPDDWAPDFRLLLGPALVRSTVRAAWAEPLAPLGDAAARVTEVEVRPGEVAGCPPCVGLRVGLQALGGDDAWAGTAEVDVEVVAAAADDGLAVRVQAQRLRRLVVAGGDAAPALTEDLRRAWAHLDAPLSSVDGGVLPVRAVRVVRSRHALAVEVLSLAARPGALGAIPALRSRGAVVQASARSLGALASRAALAVGPGADGVVVEVRSLEARGDGLDLSTRLWYPAAPVWWRDARLDLRPTPEGWVTGAPASLGASAGAGTADVARALDEVALPAARDALFALVPAGHRVTGVTVEEGAVVLVAEAASPDEGRGAAYR